MPEKVEKKVTPQQLFINLRSRKEVELFKWLLACIFFNQPVHRKIAQRTYFEFVYAGFLSAQAILEGGSERITDALMWSNTDHFSKPLTAALLALARTFKKDYRGRLMLLHEAAKDKQDLIQRLKWLVGAKLNGAAVENFISELKVIWPKAR